MTEPKPTAMRRSSGGKRYLIAILSGLLIVAVVGLLVVLNFGGNNEQAASERLPSTSTSMLATPPPNLKLLWKYDTESSIKQGTSTVANATLYVITMEVGDSSCLFYHGGWCYHLHALDMVTGKLKWTLDDYEYPPTVAGGMVYSGWDGELHAIDVGTHQVKWKFKTEDVLKDEPFVTNDIRYAPSVADGVVYFGSGGTLYALDANAGVEMWRVKYADEIASSPVVSGDFIYVIGDYLKLNRDVVKHHGNLYGVRKDNGQQLWKFEPSPSDWELGAVYAPVVVADGTVYCTQLYTGLDNPGYVSAFDGKTGQQLWKRSLAGALDYSSGPLIMYDGLLYIRDGEDNFQALDAKTGDEQWKLTDGKWSSFESAFVKETMYGENLDGEVVGVDIRSGKEISRYWAGKDFNLDAVVSDGNVYFVRQYPKGIYLFGLPK